MTLFGVHTNAQDKPLSDLVEVWKHADELGYGWISISDHLPGGVGRTSNEAVVTHAALAATTSRVQCGVLCYCAGFRHPAVLASAAVTIDHLSGGRAAIGLGSGSAPRDFEIYGFPYSSARVRTDILEESVQCVTALLREETVDFAGSHFQLTDAAQLPRPVRSRLPVWLGVLGDRGLRIAATYADGWNAGFVSPEVFSERKAFLHARCEDAGRASTDVSCSVNLMLLLGMSADMLPEERRGGALTGSVAEVVERVGAYVEAGADQVNFFLNHPWDFGGIEELASALRLPAN